jgi:hypothetical protein
MTSEDNQLQDIERELQTLRPQAPSPALQDRIRHAIDHPPARQRHGFWLAGLAAAAALIAIALILTWHPPQQPAPIVDLPIHPSPSDSQPTLWVYRKANDRSPQELERLLDQHSRSMGQIGSPTPVISF